ncbi:MAG: formate--tetrahydrofolate ligase [Candidatus Hermodarchaeota archaeon]
MKSSLEIAQNATLKPIPKLAEEVGLQPDEIELRGPCMGKIKFVDVIRRLTQRKGKYIMVTGMTPTPFGEGKTVTTIGLTDALGKLGKKAICCLRQPSMGPVFGIKGGATGGGFSQILPMEEINLGLTGDIDRVTGAHNLLTAMIDNHIFRQGNELDIDITNIQFNRVMDMNDRVLRHIVIGLGGTINGIPRESGFDITAASEIMAILALAKDYKDLRERLGKIIIGYSRSDKPIRAEDLKTAGAMAAILRDAMKPNLCQTIEGQACIMHTGPFGNLAHGCSSILADEIALRLSDYVITEAGFGADLGAEKFFDIKCRQSGLTPDAVVIVCSIRALKTHSGAYDVMPGKPFPKEKIEKEDVDAVRKGCINLHAHIEHLEKFGLPIVVAINKFATDADTEIRAVQEEIQKLGGVAVIPSTVFTEGGKGGIELAKAVLAALEEPKHFKFLYQEDMSIQKKIEIICKEIYDAASVRFAPKVLQRIKKFEEDGLGRLSICMAKTHLSISDNPNLKGWPKNYEFFVDDIRVNAGAGFIYPIAGSINTMPGLPQNPAANNIDIDENGTIFGLF